MLHLPATVGVSIGTGEPGAGTPESLTRSGAVPSAIVECGRAVTRVCTVGLGGAGVGGVVVGVVAVGVVVGPVGAVAVGGVLASAVADELAANM